MSEHLKPGLVPVGAAWPDVAGTGLRRFRAACTHKETGYVIAESVEQARAIYSESCQLLPDEEILVIPVGE
jgi:hypothetical protein